MCGVTHSCELRTGGVRLLTMQPRNWTSRPSGRPIWRASLEIINCSMDVKLGTGRGQKRVFKVDSRHRDGLFRELRVETTEEPER
jgi:hypothetical protein